MGQALNPSQQGAHVIREIKKAYPDKYIIAYTGGADQELLAPSIEAADRFTQKDTSIGDWCDLLDGAIADLANPAYVWRRVRVRLLDAGVTPYQLAVLEDEFVRSFDRSSESYKETLQNASEKLSIGRDARSILNSLIASSIFQITISIFE